MQSCGELCPGLPFEEVIALMYEGTHETVRSNCVVSTGGQYLAHTMTSISELLSQIDPASHSNCDRGIRTEWFPFTGQSLISRLRRVIKLSIVLLPLQMTPIA